MLSPIRQASRKRRYNKLLCPHCKRRLLDPVMYESVEIDTCPKCGGLWLDHRELEKILSRHEQRVREDDYQVEKISKYVGEIPRLCPVCRTHLHEYSFDDKGILLIEICQQCHGIWLEKGELENVRALHELPDAIELINRKRTWGDWFFQFFFQLPVEFNMKPRQFPFVTVSLIVLNIFIFIYELSIGASIETLLSYLALYPANIGTIQWFFSLFSYQFLHAGLLHLLSNMYFLYILGDNLEDTMGWKYYLGFYVICGIVAGFFQTVFNSDPLTPIVGASGAISGVIGGYVVLFRKARLTFFLLFFQFKLSTFWYFGIWVIINVLSAIADVGSVAWFAHLGGFVTGISISLYSYNRIVSNYPLLKYLNASVKI